MHRYVTLVIISVIYRSVYWSLSGTDIATTFKLLCTDEIFQRENAMSSVISVRLHSGIASRVYKFSQPRILAISIMICVIKLLILVSPSNKSLHC